MTREEAIRIIEANCSCSDSKLREACAIFVPELRKSENERMAEMAIKAVRSPQAKSCIKSWGVDPDDVIAWLEKQKSDWSDEDKELMYYVYEAVQTKYSDRELAKYLDPKIIGEKRELRRKIFSFLRNLGPSWKLNKEQMMKEAVKGEVIDFCFLRENDYSSAKIEFSKIPDLKVGDKVRLIIVKED